MTTIQDRLKAASAESIEQEDAKRQRGANRPAVVSGEADITLEIILDSGFRQDGSEWSDEKLQVTFSQLSNIKVAEGHEPFAQSSFTYQLPFKDKPRGNSQQALTVKAIATDLKNPAATLADLDGKRASFEEQVVPAPTRSDGSVVKDRNGYDMKPTFYYRFYNIGGTKAGSNGATPATPEEIELTVAMMVGHTPDSSRTIVKEVPAALQGKVAGRVFQREMVEAGRLSLNDQGVYELVSL